MSRVKRRVTGFVVANLTTKNELRTDGTALYEHCLHTIDLERVLRHISTGYELRTRNSAPRILFWCTQDANDSILIRHHVSQRTRA